MKTITKEIEECLACGKLSKHSRDNIKYGKSKILILGESPAKNGWIVTGKPFHNNKGKLHPTAKVLQELLSICNLTLDDINFAECCKCVIEDRNKLKMCMKNCKKFVLRQIEKLDCDIILTMGVHPTETILDMKVDKLANYVGRKFMVKFGEKEKVVIPIYHTSPANPLCLKGNIKAFENIAKII